MSECNKCNKPCSEEQGKELTMTEIMEIALETFTEECFTMAKENWTPSQVEMLETLFVAVGGGYEYKCIRCKYFGKAPDAPETARKDCMYVPESENDDAWIPSEGEWVEEEWKRPCELEE